MVTACVIAVRHTDKYGHIIIIKLQDGDETGKLLPIYVGNDSALCFGFP